MPQAVRTNRPETIRTRFAPSPTGYLHIGGARTALFNYLVARRCGGKFLLRIEDTDQTRNIAGAEQKLLDDLRWLGLQWDEGPEVGGPAAPYYQSQRLERYAQAARQLLEAGSAYYAFETPEELEAMRRAAQHRGQRGFRYPRPERLPTESDAQLARDAGRPVVIRFKMPQRDFVIRDEILGDVTVAATELSDFVIVKADGWPTYHFAVVVDDEDMQITHVLRGQEHLLNSANHMGLQEALGYRTPAYAHLPIIMNMDGSKMSKREKDKAVRTGVQAALAAGRLDARTAAQVAGGDAATFEGWLAARSPLDGEALLRLGRRCGIDIPEIDIHDFRASGYLPEVLVNFIALLGWSPGDDREKFTLDELCQVFSIERVGKKSAHFDRDKLLNFNTTAVAAAEIERSVGAFRDYLGVNPPGPLSTVDDATLRRIVEMNAGFRVFRDLDQKAAVLFAPDDQIEYESDAVKKWLLKGEAAGLQVLRELRDLLAAHVDWSEAELEQLIRGFAEQRGLGLGKVAQPLRIAATGTTVSPSIFGTLSLLGREKMLGRIDRLLARMS